MRAIGAVLTLFALGACAAPAEPAKPIDHVFPDAALAACVATTAGVPDAKKSADLAGIEELHCDSRGAPARIRSLEGVEQLTALNVLDLPGNEISDLTPLHRMSHLGTLTLTDNQVADLSPLAGMKLFDLGLSQNPVSDLTPLEDTTTLNALGVAAAQIT